MNPNPTITLETILATRQWFADNALACIAAAERKEFWVNDLAEYTTWIRQVAADALAGKDDHTFAFRQRAHFIQTGKSPALLPPMTSGANHAASPHRPPR